MPSPTSTAPDILSIILPRRAIFTMRGEILSKAKATIRNGTASPREKTASNNAPAPTLPDAVAISKIEPRIGPIQGVHPTPNAIPSNKELSVRDGVNRLNRRFVAVRNNGRRNMPKRDTPKIMINTPALYSSQRRHANKNCPPHPNAVQNKINNSEQPKTKQAKFTIT